MPRPATARPITETMTVILRVQRQLELSPRLTPQRLKRIKEHLGAILSELQQVEQGAGAKGKSR